MSDSSANSSLPLPFPLPETPPAPVSQAMELVPTVSPQEIGSLIEQAGGGGLGIAAALIAVAGGGAAFKFYSQFSKNRHEEKMEKMRLESEKQDKEHGKCAAERLSLVAKLDAVSAQLAEMEKKQQALSLSVGDDLEDRLEALEKKVSTGRKKAPVRRKKSDD